MTQSRRALCGAVDIKGWSGRRVPEQIRAQQALVDVVRTACRQAGLPGKIVQSSGDGVLIMPPSDIDESVVIPDLIQEMRIALRRENRMLAEPARIRLRFALTSGLVMPGPAGFNGMAVIDCFRLLDSPPVRKALTDFPHAELAVIVSDHLFQDVVRHGFRDLEPEDFWQVRTELPDKGFSADAWVFVSDRTGGPPAEPVPPAPHEAPRPTGPVAEARALADEGRPGEALALLDRVSPEGEAEWLALLDVRADGLFQLGEYDRARMDLEEILALQPDPAAAPAPAALLRLGRCHARLGAEQAARHTWLFLLEQHRAMTPVYLELGRLERCAGQDAAARSYLLEGIRLLGAEGAADGPPLEGFLAELAALRVDDGRPPKKDQETAPER